MITYSCAITSNARFGKRGYHMVFELQDRDRTRGAVDGITPEEAVKAAEAWMREKTGQDVKPEAVLRVEDAQVICMGVDLGKVSDPSAVVVTEYTPVRVMENGEYWIDIGPTPEEKKWTKSVPDTLYDVRLLQRIPLGTSYPNVAREINAMCKRLKEGRPFARIHLVVDKTGVGAGPVDILREMLDKSIRLTAVTFTGTDKCDYAPLQRPEASCGKAFMVVRLQTTLQKDLLHLPKGEMITAVVVEMRNFEVRTTITGHDTYGAFKIGTHDDLISALGLSILGTAKGDDVQTGPAIYQ